MEEGKTLHIVMFPWLAFGHITPFLELSKRLASKGHQISFISTPRNLQRLPKIPQHLSPFITLIPLPLPSKDDQCDLLLPPDAESTADVPFDKVGLLKKAYDCLENPMSSFLETTSPVDWIIYDFSAFWVPPIADRLGIRKAFFSILNAWSFSAFGPTSTSEIMNDGGTTWANAENLTKPLDWIPFPNPIMFSLHEAKATLGLTPKNSSGVSDFFRGSHSVNGCDLIAVRSCMELEAEYLQLLEKLHGKPVIPVGLLPISIPDEGEGGDDDTWQSIKDWLDKHRNGTVVYVALGSEVALSQDQITELALGLEISQMPFLWAWRKPTGGSAELPDRFEERIRDHGLVWTKWAPQPRILSHDSVGVFLTHCGWGSIIEGLQFERPLIMLPFVLDQGLNARVMAANKVGIERVRNDEDGSFTRNSVAESLKIMHQDEPTGNIYRKEAKKMSDIIGNKNLQGHYFDRFEQYLRAGNRLIR